MTTDENAGKSLTFDRAADFYDRTRSLSDEAAARVTDLLATELVEHQPVIEIGVGTGRIALPLARKGLQLVGVDLSRPMLDKLRDNSGGGSPVALAIADATQLPCPPASLGGAVACHVFHLIPQWRAAVAELVRVTRPGGVVLADIGGWGKDEWGAVARRFGEELEALRPGVKDAEELDDAFLSFGARLRVLPVIEDRRVIRPGDLIDDLEAGLFSITWHSTPAELSRAAAATRRWAETTLGPLDRPVTVTAEISWRAYDLLSPPPSPVS